jgi:flagellar biosynthesis/type III secretory pathway protein FliH
MDQHLITELKELLKPMRDELTKIAEQAVKKVINTTAFTLRADKTPLP